MLNKMTGRTKAVAFLLAAVLLAGTGISAWAGEEEESEKTICRRAAERCVAEAVFKSGFTANWIGLVVSLTSCFAGYDFCRRFIFQFAGEMAR